MTDARPSERPALDAPPDAATDVGATYQVARPRSAHTPSPSADAARPRAVSLAGGAPDAETAAAIVAALSMLLPEDTAEAGVDGQGHATPAWACAGRREAQARRDPRRAMRRGVGAARASR